MNPAVELPTIDLDVTSDVVRQRLSTRYPVRWIASGERAVTEEVGGERIRRAVNVTVALVLLLLLAPLMLVIAVLIKVTSPGPVFYVQTRVGVDRRRGWGRGSAADERRRIDYGGKLFTIYKFRTMTWDEGCMVQRWASADDPRVTRLGQTLRKFRVDELPQLVNVLKGDMNLVGPRPEQPKLFVELREHIPHYAERQRVLPGITGWAQVRQGYDATLDDVRSKVALDLEYIRRTSALRDLSIMLRTVPVVLFQRGAR